MEFGRTNPKKECRNILMLSRRGICYNHLYDSLETALILLLLQFARSLRSDWIPCDFRLHLAARIGRKATSGCHNTFFTHRVSEYDQRIDASQFRHCASARLRSSYFLVSFTLLHLNFFYLHQVPTSTASCSQLLCQSFRPS